MIQLRHNPAPADFEHPLLEAEIAPTRSIDRRITRWILALFAASCLIIGLLFWWRGATPVMGFMGLEIVLLFGAFWLSFRDAAAREALSLNGTETTVYARHPSGSVRTTRLQTYWLNVSIEGLPSRVGRLILRSRDQSVELGSFLSPHERLELADAIKEALFRSKEGPRPRPNA